MQRLDKILCDAGTASRKELKIMIKKGRVSVDGIVIKTPETKVDTASEICIDGEVIQTLHKVVLIMNKPAGYVTSTDDPRDLTVMELVPPQYRNMGVLPAGRLDKDTEGLLVFTNDGNLIHRLISPKSELQKKYYAEFEGILAPDAVKNFKNGIILKDKSKCKSAELEVLSESSCNVTIREGMFHQVKRMLASQGVKVTYLKRLQMGPYLLGELKSGQVIDVTSLHL